MSVSNDDTQQKGFACDRIENACDDELPAHAIVEAERQLSVFANAKKHWRVLLVGKFIHVLIRCSILTMLKLVSPLRRLSLMDSI